MEHGQKRTVSLDSINMSSDSSDEENLDLLREAVDHTFLNDSMFTEKHINSEKTPTIENTLPPSLRRKQDEDEQFNLFRVTPQFQQYVAKHLSNNLEQKLQKLLKSVKDKKPVPTQKKPKSGVRLFSNSEKFFKADKHNVSNHNSVNRRLKRTFERVDESALREVAVSSEDILSQKDTKFWSNRSKAPVYHYKQSIQGELVLVQPPFQ